MSGSEIKDNIHKLIDGIESEYFLSDIYNLLVKYKNSASSSLYYNLSEEEKSELLLSEEESKNNDNLISTKEIFKKYGK